MTVSPYYEAEGVTIYHADCRDILPELRADVLITDPPYGVGLVARQARNPGRGGSHKVNPAGTIYDDDPERIAELIRTAIPAALEVTERALIFSGYSAMFHYPRPDVVGGVYMPAGAGYTPWGFGVFQPILYYGADPYLADGKGNRPNGFRGHGGAGKFDHPCPKPLQWMTWAVERASRVGELILDPFMGTGTTLLAAKLSGRRAIGIDSERRYCDIAVGRFAQGILPLWPDADETGTIPMFTP